jgi:flagellar hook-length control protein FliK
VALNSILATPVSPPPKPASSNSSSSSSSSHSSFGADDSSGSPSASQSSSSSNSASTSDNGNATRNSGQNASSRNSSSSHQAQQTQNSSSSSQSKQSNSSTQTQSTNAASNGKDAASQTSKSPGASFLQALAQTQADAQDSVSATATGAPQAITGKGKGKSTKDDGSTDPSASFGFLSQSLVAAMAGIQQPSPTQGATDGDDSVDGVSLSSGTSAQSLVATLMQNTADDLKAAGGDDAKPDAATTTPAGDANASAASTFQSHLGVSSHLQTSATQEAANTQVSSPVGSDGFAEEVGDKITWMAHQGVQSASLKMTPENMGPVEVRISVQDGSASVAFNAAHADTRAALEQALPRLREMFSTQGLNLSDASVSQQFSRGQPQKQAIGAIGSVGSVSDETTSSVVSVASARLGLVDTYA